MRRPPALVLFALVLAVPLFGCGGGGGGSSKGSSGGSGGTTGGTTGGIGMTTGGITTAGATTGASTGATTGAVTAPGTNFAYVASFGGGAVDVYDVATGTRATGITGLRFPSDVAVGGSTPTVAVADFGARTLTTYDPLASTVRRTIDLSQAPIASNLPIIGSMLDPLLRMGYAPMGAVVAANGKVYVPGMISTTSIDTNGGMKGILDIDLSATGGSIFGALMAPVQFGAFRAATVGDRVYVTNFFTNTVTVIDTTSDDRIATVPVGAAPAGIAIDRNGKTAYVCCAFDGAVYAIDTTTNQVSATYVAGVGPIDVACDPHGDYVYVANYLSGDITKIDALAGVVVANFPASSMTSLMNALGLNQSTMQAMLNQILGSLGTGGGGTSTGMFSTFLNMLLGGTGATGSGGIIGTMMNQILSMFTGGGTGAGLPMAGVCGIGVSTLGDVLVVSNGVTSEVGFIDTATATVKTSVIPMLTSPTPSIGGVTSIAIYSR